MPSPRLDLARARDLMDQARAAAPAADVEITVEAVRSSLTRFANNAIHQHVAEDALVLSVRTQFDQRCARASTHRLDAFGVREAVDRAVRLTRSQSPDPDLVEMATPSGAPAPQVDRFDPPTAAITPTDRARAVEAMVAEARQRKLTAAGICSTRQTQLAILNSRGVEARYEDTGAEYSVTMLGESSSGWAKANSFRWGDLDPAAGAAVAAQKAMASARPAEMPAGRYTVILEPSAVLDLLGFAMWDFGGLSILDQRSFLNERVGTKLFADNVTIADDVSHPLQTGAPFDGEGVPRQRVSLVENGWIRNLVFSRPTAALWNKRRPSTPVAPTGHGFSLPNEYGEAPLNVVFAGGDVPVERMIAETEQGILVTRLWYIREVDPYRKILTGMTRDGTFLIEHGRLSRGLRNFRFNQSMIDLLNQVEAMSPAVRASGEESFDMVVPALKVAGFNFTEVTKF